MSQMPTIQDLTNKQTGFKYNGFSTVPVVKDLGFIGSWRQEQTIELTRARLIQALA
jgi:hypothetical protein